MSGDFQLVPIWRLTDRMVRSTLVTAWRLATSPTSTSPFLAKATIDGVVRAPSAFAMTVGSPPSRTETTELVVPRSIPTARDMQFPPAKCPTEPTPPGHLVGAARVGPHRSSSVRSGPSGEDARGSGGCQAGVKGLASVRL